ncbi:MAG: HAD hydrolase-like protein [Coriobacteriia bacterium]|nr:HAD hydrolase-like protein [Coriobacteriia bacterium]
MVAKLPFRPDRYFDRVSSIDVTRDVIDEGIEVVLLDVDNTLRSRADGMVPPDVLHWLVLLKEAGIQPCLLSNNWHGNVYDLGNELDIPVIAKACKPFPFAFVRAMYQMGSNAKTTLMVGDQLSTDIWGAHLVGIRAYLVMPLAKVDLKHTRYVRRAEQVFVSGMTVECGKGKTKMPQAD